MKKLFTVLLSFCAMLFAMQANAQAIVTLTAGDVWGDGSGYQMLLDADHTAYGTTIPASGALTSSGDATAAVYAEFEYKIPVNADGSCTTQNIVINNSVTISIPAGTYDWCITNPTPGDRIWIASSNGNVGGRADDYVFENGKTYTFTVTRGGNNDQVDVVVTLNPTGPAIDASPNTFNFGSVAIGQSKTKTSNVMGFFLSTGITATTAAPFEVSSNGTSYNTTATLDSAGGTLYMRYSPTSAGTDSGTVVLVSDSVTITISLVGTGIDCSQAITQLPWTEDFSGDVFPPLCWDVIATLPDTTWDVYDYNGGWASCLGASQTRVEQLITKKFDFSNYTHTVLMDFDFMSNYSYISDGTKDMKIYASTDGGVTFSTTPLWAMSQVGQFSNWTPTLATVDLSSLAGQSNVVFKFTAEGSRCQVMFTNLKIYAYDQPTIVVLEDEFSFYTEVNTNSDAVELEVEGYNLSDALTATTTAPFAVSADGSTYGTTATLTGNKLYVRYSPTAVGDHAATVTLSSTGATNVLLNLDGSAYDCSGITLPYTENFNHAGFLPGCVTLDYACGDPTINPMIVMLKSQNDPDDYAFRFSSYNTISSGDYGQYFITPQLPNNTGLTLSFDWYNYYTAETMNIGYSTTDNNISSFNWLGEEEFNTSGNEFESYTVGIPAGARYIALNYTSNYQYYLYIDNLTITGELVNVEDHENVATIYPNPANNVLNINANSNISMVEVFNVMGQMVASFDANDVKAQINTSNFANGVYTVRIHTENGVSNQKFTVAR